MLVTPSLKQKQTSPKTYNKNLAIFCTALKKHDHFLLSGHVLPEGDAIGSIFALDSLLRRLGKKTTVVGEDDFPKRLYCFSPKRWNRYDQIKKPAGGFRALVLVDCATLDRIGKVKSLLTPETIIFNIDHHISNNRFGAYNCVKPEAAASGEVVFDIFKYFRFKITKEEAKFLYAAISTDTGSFRYGNTTERTFQIAEELLRTGIDLEEINQNLYDTYSLNKINLYSRLLGRVKSKANGQVAWSVMTRQDLFDSGAIDEDMEGFIDFLKSIREVKIAFFLSELPEKGVIRVSFRSKGKFDVNKIATGFNGGGHKKSSGCSLYMTLEEAEKNILQQIKRLYSFE